MEWPEEDCHAHGASATVMRRLTPVPRHTSENLVFSAVRSRPCLPQLFEGATSDDWKKGEVTYDDSGHMSVVRAGYTLPEPRARVMVECPQSLPGAEITAGR